LRITSGRQIEAPDEGPTPREGTVGTHRLRSRSRLVGVHDFPRSRSRLVGVHDFHDFPSQQVGGCPRLPRHDFHDSHRLRSRSRLVGVHDFPRAGIPQEGSFVLWTDPQSLRGGGRSGPDRTLRRDRGGMRENHAKQRGLVPSPHSPVSVPVWARVRRIGL
jgi:hypothetical protein